LAASQRVLGFLIAAILLAGVGTVFLKGPDEPPPLTIGPTESPTPTPSETFTFPGPIPTETQTELFPTATESAAGPTVSPGEELPRTGGGNLFWPAGLTLAMAAGAGLIIRRTARSVS
jgi:LPXTG-motif cell wall-anchored protein